MSDKETDKLPTLNWEQPEATLKDGTTREAPDCHLAFGYMNDEPVAVLFVGDSTEYTLIPRDILGIAFHQGWGPEYDVSSED